MTTTRKYIDWERAKQRLGQFQPQNAEVGVVDRERMNAVFRQRAERIARRGRQDAAQTVRAPVLVLPLGNERFGIELSQVKQVFARVPVTVVPGAPDTLLGVANLNGTLRTAIDLRRLLNLSAAQTDIGYIVLLRASGKLLGMWVETVESVRQVELDKLAPVDAAATGPASGFIKGTTDDGILVLDAEALVQHVAEQCGKPTGGQ